MTRKFVWKSRQSLIDNWYRAGHVSEKATKGLGCMEVHFIGRLVFGKETGEERLADLIILYAGKNLQERLLVEYMNRKTRLYYNFVNGFIGGIQNLHPDWQETTVRVVSLVYMRTISTKKPRLMVRKVMRKCCSQGIQWLFYACIENIVLISEISNCYKTFWWEIFVAKKLWMGK